MIFSVAAALVVVLGSWRQWMSLRAYPLWQAAFTPSLGWNQNLAYYTSYGAIWRVCVPNLRAFVALLKLTVPLLVLAPGRYLVTPLEEPPSMLQFAFALILTAAIVSGMIRQARSHGWKPIHFALPFYCVIVLAWPYPLMGRFLLPFLPLFLAGLWTELRRLAAMLRSSLRPAMPPSERCVAGVLAVLAVFLLLFAGWKILIKGRRPCRSNFRPINGYARIPRRATASLPTKIHCYTSTREEKRRALPRFLRLLSILAGIKGWRRMPLTWVTRRIASVRGSGCSPIVISPWKAIRPSLPRQPA